MNNLVSISIHLNQNINDKVKYRIEAVAGVSSVEKHDKQEHLMIVNYDSQVTSMVDILNSIKNLGMQGQLIG